MHHIRAKVGAICDDQRDHDLELGLVNQPDEQNPNRPDAKSESNSNAGHEDEAKRPVEE